MSGLVNRHTKAVSSLVFACMLLAAIPFAQSQTLTVLYRFSGGREGSDPQGGLIQDSLGTLYGTATHGNHNEACNGWGCGVVYKFDPQTGEETVLHSFAGGSDGEYPYGSLVMDMQGNLYGTTQQGGAKDLGIVYKLDALGNETILHSFSGGADGQYPMAGLTPDSAGNLYGTTFGGGTFNCGTIFRVTSSGQETVAHSFAGGTDGANPTASLTRDNGGNFYGTTEFGGLNSLGSIFQLSASGTEWLLFSFDGSQGAMPLAGLLRDESGNLFGTTTMGGEGRGVVFEVDSSGRLVLAQSLTNEFGALPSGTLVRAANGSIYGTAVQGGNYGTGTIFELSPTRGLRLVYTFDSPFGIGYPVSGLTLGQSGVLYGTAANGGFHLAGGIFEIQP